jgi:hypothetical protein
MGGGHEVGLECAMKEIVVSDNLRYYRSFGSIFQNRCPN